MNLEKAIKERRSVQLFDDRPVKQELIVSLLDTAVWVPNHKMTQPWRFVFVTGDHQEQLAELSGEYAAKDKTGDEKEQIKKKTYQNFLKVPVLLMVIMGENENLRLREEDYASTSIVVHNLSLLAWEQGIGMFWKTGPLTQEKHFQDFIGVKEGEKFVGMIQMGYPTKVPKARPRVDVAKRITELT